MANDRLKAIIEKDLNFNSLPLISQRKAKAFKQADVHINGAYPRELLELKRPGEDQEIIDYRLATYRRITVEPFKKLLDWFCKTLVASSYQIQNKSDRINDFLEENKTSVLIESFFRNSSLDANGIKIPFPLTDQKDKLIPPSYVPENGGLSGSKLPQIDCLKIKHDAWILEDEFLIWNPNLLVEFDYMQGVISKPMYYASDDISFYRAIPISLNDKGKTVYRIEVWYNHNIGEIPFIEMDGMEVETGEGFYKESHLMPVFEFGDEVITSFSDDQANRTRHNHPVRILGDVACTATGCEGGKIKNLERKENDPFTLDCPSCRGSGITFDVSPYGTLVRPPSIALSGGNDANKAKLVDYADIPTEPLKHSWVTWKELFQMMKTAANVDLLDGKGVESGEAKKERLRSMDANVSKRGEATFGQIEKYYCFVEGILYSLPEDKNERLKPKIIRPTSYDTKTATDLLEDLNSAPKAQRLPAHKAYTNKINSGNPVEAYKIQMAVKYSPMFLMDSEEIDAMIAKGACSTEDFIRYQRVQTVIDDIHDERGDDITKLKRKDFFALIDEAMKEFLPEVVLPQNVNLDGEGNPLIPTP